MLSETMDSPSSYNDEHFIHDERQDGFWKTNAVNQVYGTKSNGLLSQFAASPLEKDILMNSHIRNGFAPQDSYLSRDKRANPSSERFTSISEKGASMSLPRGFQHIIGSASYNTEGDKVNFTSAPYENGLFSSSLSELFSRKLRLSSTNALFGHSVGAAEPHEDEEPFECLKELEAQTIGDLLPDDDEELFSGVADGINRNARLINGDEIEEDLFCSVGGLELGEDGDIHSETLILNSNSQLRGCNGASGMQHPSDEHPSRTLIVRNIDSNVEDSELQSLFQQFGDIRTLYTACKHRGFIMISYYDIRAAWNAMKALQKKPLQNRNLDIHFSIPKDTPEKDVNQGTLVVFNLDSSVSNDKLQQMFGVYGEIKKIYEVPHRNSHKFIEFYDVRAAEAAFHALKKTDIGAKRIILEPSLPGADRRSMYEFPSELDQENSSTYQQQSIPPSNFMTELSRSISLEGMTSNLDNGSVVDTHFSDGLPMSPYRENEFLDRISASVPNSLPSVLSVGSTSHIPNSIEASNSLGQLKFDIQGTPSFHCHSFSDHHNGLANGLTNIGGRSPELLEKPFGRVNLSGHPIDLNANVFNMNGNGSPGQQHYLWSNTPRPQPQGIWQNSPSFVNGACSPLLPQQMYTIARAPSHLSSGFLPISNHHVGSAPSINPSVLERRNVFAAKSPDPSVFNPGSLGSMRIPGGSPHSMEFIPHNVFSCNGGSIDLPTPKNLQMHPQNQRCMMVPGRGQMVSMMSSYYSPSERTRSRRNEASSSQGDRKQFELDIDRIMRGEDKRTTLMIKNIPNKYTSKMLLAAIDERHRGNYDFLYLPIDFKNKCNVGYAFINMTEPTLIVPFYQALNGRKWEKFNSEKVASLAYARIQGKVALISHFQNSSLMNEDKRCHPILFHTEGPNAGDQVPFPMGVKIRPRGGKNRSNTSEENNQENPPNSLIDEESSNE